ncbi:PD40 domain-containing protein, partial [Candidatus Bipolaricaulota bacterium]|nr:PD40 domain-containing protein [Candidatus Bipolaricaulota bacterium]
NEIQPSWSKVGTTTTIAYASNAAQTPSSTTWEIWTIPAGGGTSTQLTTQTPSWAIAPAYSPVNDDIVFVSNKDAEAGGSAIWLWDDSASSASELYNSGFSDGDVSSDLAVFDAALATSLNLPADSGISKPAWSPDGTKIAFSSDMTTGSIGGIDVWIITVNESVTPPTASNLQNLNTFSGGTPNTTGNEFCPYWLEDGSGLAFVKEVGATYHIYKVSFSTGAVTQLTSTGNNVTPAERKVGPPLAGPHKEV